jgi:peptide/nickel transport system substrate-binding protein
LGLGATAAVLLAGCASTAPSSSPSGGGTVTFAEGPGAPPNYILPLTSGAYFTTSATTDFSQILYLPLYWFGQTGQAVLNKSLSVAYPPVFSNKNTVATVTLKHWMWSNGTPITARDVIFWMNLLSAVTDPDAPTVGSNSAPGPGWGASVPGGFPQNVVSYDQTGTYTVVFHLNASYNPTWYLYNELSQIYTMPQKSWDKLSTSGSVGNADTSAATRILAPASAGLPADSYIPANPGTATTGALGVAQFLNVQSQDLSTYTTNPLWQVVDGSFKLSQFTVSGFVKMVPNKEYSGLPKPTISAFEEEPFTSDTAEFDALSTGSLTIGYIPTQDLAQKASLEKSKGYSYNAWYIFSFNFARYNFTNPTAGPILNQLYFRQAFQSLVNQAQYIKDFGAGIGAVTNGPVPTYPPNNVDESPLEAKGVYPYDATKAVTLLKDNGWTVKPGGTSYCSKPGTASGDCGAGISANQPLTFNFLYGSGIVELTDEMEAMQSALSKVAGITIHLSTAPFSIVVGTIHGNCSSSHPCSDWEIAATGGGWVYSPDYLPTGEEIFEPGAGSNAGDYSSATDDANITATTTAPTNAAETNALFKYENYLAEQLPDVWLPTNPSQLTMYKSDLTGVVPQGIFGEIYPQDYSFKS